ncbi:beta-ketoadipate enol-lactone hydrolase protein [Fulvimarina pelagi HTCC2506]|uniref:Beta-ketoadipate enol-lactone hydrolase protein n=2 Tax=Fulvimarina pelagi TaxID=217511 RepID=Q0G1H9_9HYPH|nr:3-oxoadipate enol-lactonase [Fulvimarina pelagi]EAU41102.1 beta-ketoadipate enol-lactone hydrolase protein [Fulvimarina pelagi HTCC2506]BAT30883.1 beta-ketoadipate enol-lactone hydrolase protein [Fulvimarina pelagi]
MQSATIDGLSVHVDLTVGAGSGAPAIVFSNSLGTDFRIWDDVVAALAGRYTILRYDSRGHGLTDIGETPYSMSGLSTDLAALMDAFGISDAVVVGLSVGGMIAQDLALSRPDLLRGLVLSNTAHKIGDAAAWNQRIDTIRADGLDAIAEATMEKWFTPGFRRADNSAYQVNRNMFLRAPLEGYIATCHALSKADYSDTVGDLSVPALCIAGDQDGSTPAELVKSLSDKIAGSQFEVIENAAHIPCVEQPEAYADRLEGFIAGLR